MLKYLLIKKKMKILFKYSLYLFVVLFSLTSCQNVKDGLTGKKKSNSDEFLVEKKNSLTLPPEFDKLPEPKSLNTNDGNEETIDVKSIFGKIYKSNTKTSNTEITNSSLEKSILEKIRKN